MDSQSGLQPRGLLQQPSSSSHGGAETANGTSRKSTRRGDGEGHESLPSSSSFSVHGPTNGVSPAPPQTLTSGATRGSWGASLSPRAYMAACRATGQEALHAPTVITTTPPQGSIAAASLSMETPLHRRWQPHAHRCKRRRTEQVSFTSLYKEVFMYLDAVAATRQDHVELGEGTMAHTHDTRGRAEEDAQAMRGTDSSDQRSYRGISIRSYSAPPSFNGLALPFTSASAHSGDELHTAYATRTAEKTPATPPTAALHMSVDAAVADALRVLRACWEYRGAPHDAFEPVRLLSPITVHLLTTYGHHAITHGGDYVVLRGGAEQLPWVGCLYGILQLYAYRQQQRRQQHSMDHRDDQHPARCVGTVDDSADPASPLHNNISRVLLLNCHSFGWLDHVGSDEYERSHRQLHQTREALTNLLEDERYAALGQHTACPLCSSTMVGGDASTAVLLGNTIVMEGGAPSLGLASPRDTFTAHYQYGRGIACFVPEQQQRQQCGWSERSAPFSDLQRPPHSHSGGGGGGNGRRDGVIRSGLCAMHQASLREERRRHAVRWPAEPSLDVPHLAEEEYASRSSSGNGNGHGTTSAMPYVLSPPSPYTFYSPFPCSALEVSHFPPVCCGTCRAAGVLGQALLLGPTGPLLIHLQFEEREWWEAAAPLMGCPSCDGALFNDLAGQVGWAALETTAVCPAPLINTATFSTDPAGALAAVLYARMQGHDATRSSGCGSVKVPPLTSIPGGGTVPLAEFVEWLVRLLHAPPPALVVEWHACSPASPLRSCGAFSKKGDCYTESGEQQACPTTTTSAVRLSSPTSVASCSTPAAARQPSPSGLPSANTPSPYPEDTNPYATAAAARSHSSSDSAELQHPPSYPSYVHDGFNDHSSSGGAASLPSAPLGMTVRPRVAVVPQLLETYADVMESRPVPTNVANSAVGVREAAATALGTTPSLGTHYDLQSALTRASEQVAGQDTVLVEWVLEAHDGLKPCEATAFFDGVERPLVLAKGLEVVTEGERYVNANSVVTSLQFRPIPSGARDFQSSSR
jgi:hypothetical protein